MDPASLRIKFSPIIKKISQNSKCYVEIVPEVSDVKNMEKLKWNTKDNTIEYTVPMTYKIFIKKQEPENSMSGDLDRTYHSCVELLQDHSLCDYDLGSGDVMRILSDNVINNKYASMDDANNLTPHQRVSYRCYSSSNAKSIDMIREEAVLSDDVLGKLETGIDQTGLNDDANEVEYQQPFNDTFTDTCSAIDTPKRKCSQYRLHLSATSFAFTSTNATCKVTKIPDSETEKVKPAYTARAPNDKNIESKSFSTGSSNNFKNNATDRPISDCNSDYSKKEPSSCQSIVSDKQYIPVTSKRSTENIQEGAYKKGLRGLYQINSLQECFKDNCYHDVHKINFQTIPVKSSDENDTYGDSNNGTLNSSFEFSALQECFTENCYHDLVVYNENLQSTVADASLQNCDLYKPLRKDLDDSKNIQMIDNCYRDIYNKNIHSVADNPNSSTENIRDGNIYKKDFQNFNKPNTFKKCVEDDGNQYINKTNLTPISEGPNCRSTEIICDGDINKEELKNLYEFKTPQKNLEDNFCHNIINDNFQSIDKPKISAKTIQGGHYYTEQLTNLQESNALQDSFKDIGNQDVQNKNCQFLVLLVKNASNGTSKTVSANIGTQKIPIEKIGNCSIKDTNSDMKSPVTPKLTNIMCNDKVSNKLTTYIRNVIVCNKVPDIICPYVGKHPKQLLEKYDSLEESLRVRTPPETRIANFVIKLEMDFLPLKVELNDIYNKCICMGITMQKLRVAEKFPETLYDCDKGVRTCGSNNSNKSNRVVYTMSFQG